MRSVEEIQRKLEDEKQASSSFETDLIIGYLQGALLNDEAWAKRLLYHYNYEINEDQVIVRTLKWILGESDEI